jgi:hypothetical protein
MTCQGCGIRLTLTPSASATTSSNNTERLIQQWHLQPYVCKDNYTGLDAFRMLIPQGWQVQGGIDWVFEHAAIPYRLKLQIFNPQGYEAYELLPDRFFLWYTHPQMQQMLPPGTVQNGSEIRPPVNAQQAVYEYVLAPRYRNLPGVEVLKIEPAPDWVAKVRNPQIVQEGLKLRVSYKLGQQQILEDILAIVEYMQTKVPVANLWGVTQSDLISWDIRSTLICRAAPEQLDRLTELFQVMTDSCQPNQQWKDAARQISQYLVQNKIQQINQAGAIAREIGRRCAQTSDMVWQSTQSHRHSQDDIWSSYENRQDVMDRAATRVDQAIRGVDEYYDPFKEQAVELPSGSTQAWTNPLGEIVTTDKPGEDPNIGSTTSWTELERR